MTHAVNVRLFVTLPHFKHAVRWATLAGIPRIGEEVYISLVKKSEDWHTACSGSLKVTHVTYRLPETESPVVEVTLDGSETMELWTKLFEALPEWTVHAL